MLQLFPLRLRFVLKRTRNLVFAPCQGFAFCILIFTFNTRGNVGGTSSNRARNKSNHFVPTPPCRGLRKLPKKESR